MKNIYINFPISLLRDATLNIKQTCNNIIDYGVYEFNTLKEGTDLSLKIQSSLNKRGLDLIKKPDLFEHGKILFNEAPKNCPKSGVSIKILLDFIYNEKSEFEIEQFLAFCALRSIIYQKKYCLTSNAMLLARMAGYSSEKEMACLPRNLLKYQKRYHIGKLKSELQNNWGLKLYSYRMRGYYFSFALELEELVIEAEMSRKRYLNNVLAAKKKKIRIDVLKQISRNFDTQQP